MRPPSHEAPDLSRIRCAQGHEPSLVVLDAAKRFTQKRREGPSVLDDLEWYPRLGDVPGVAYETPAGFSPETLPGYGLTPERSTSGHSLWWKSRPAHTDDPHEEEEIITSESPASAYAMSYGGHASGARIVERLQGALELPGTATDYHFALAAAVENLYAIRATEPAMLETVERLCWLDIQLIEARPAAFLWETPEGARAYYSFPTFSRLITLYSTEGYLREALAVIERARPFDQSQQHREKVLGRIAAVGAVNE
jgi:hypothetical protein